MTFRPWKDGGGVEADVQIVRTSERELFVVTAPSPYTVYSGNEAPLNRGTGNALLRPYEQLLEHGKPDVGRVQYYMVRIGDDIRTLFALSLCDHNSSLRSPHLLPGRIFLYPGFGQEGAIHGASGERVTPHHITIRETAGGIVSYMTARRADGSKFRSPTVRELPVPGSILHVASARVSGPRFLEPAGIAAAPIRPHVRRARAGKDFLPQNLVQNHWLDDIEAPKELTEGAHHLWMIIVLTEERPRDEDLVRTIRWLKFTESRNGKEIVPRDYDGNTSFSATGVDLHALGIKSRYRHLVTIRGIVPGSIPSGTFMFAFPSVIPPARKRDAIIG